jgi:heptosyltransferase III
MRRILVLRGGALGDFIVTLPALALMRRRWPDARIELAGNARASALVTAGGLLDAVHSQHEGRWSALFAEGELPHDFGAWLAGFDLVVNYWPDPDGALRNWFPLREGQQFLTASAWPQRSPAAAHYCEPLAALGLETRSFFCGLERGLVIPGGLPARRPEVRHGAIALHPGSGSPRKNWPLERWAEFASALRRNHPDRERLIISGEAETDNLLANLGRPLRNRTLPELADELARCRLFVGHDSGVSHLAAACGVPCVLLFGPTDPEVWAPPAAHVTVIRRGVDLGAITVPEVARAVDAALLAPP